MAGTKAKKARFRLIQVPVTFHGAAVVVPDGILFRWKRDRVHVTRCRAVEDRGLYQKDSEESYAPGCLHA